MVHQTFEQKQVSTVPGKGIQVKGRHSMCPWEGRRWEEGALRRGEPSFTQREAFPFLAAVFARCCRCPYSISERQSTTISSLRQPWKELLASVVDTNARKIRHNLQVVDLSYSPGDARVIEQHLEAVIPLGALRCFWWTPSQVPSTVMRCHWR